MSGLTRRSKSVGVPKMSRAVRSRRPARVRARDGPDFVVLDEKLAVPGAQEVAVFEKAIRQVFAG